MRMSRFSDERIIAILKEHAAGFSAAELCRKHGVSNATLYKWRSRCGDREASDAKRLRALEDENGNPKTLPTEGTLDVATLSVPSPTTGGAC